MASHLLYFFFSSFCLTFPPSVLLLRMPLGFGGGWEDGTLPPLLSTTPAYLPLPRAPSFPTPVTWLGRHVALWHVFMPLPFLYCLWAWAAACAVATSSLCAVCHRLLNMYFLASYVCLCGLLCMYISSLYVMCMSSFFFLSPNISSTI